jgi:hypothetical protein
MKNLAWCFLFCAPLISAQSFSFGAKGGGLFTEPANRADDSRRYVVGPSVEVEFPLRLAVEVDALYSRFGRSERGIAASRTRGDLWEFPVLGKYYLSGRGATLRPFASAGVSFRNIWIERDRSNRIGQAGSTEPGIGAVVGGGVGFRIGRFTVAPELRYTRWGGYNFPATNLNQLQGLVNIGFSLH